MIQKNYSLIKQARKNLHVTKISEMPAKNKKKEVKTKWGERERNKMVITIIGEQS